MTDFGRRRPEESETTDHWALGDEYGIHFPAHARALRDGGTAFLTTAFQTAGTLAADNHVTAIDRCAEVGGGSTGRKLALSVRYRRPEAGLHTELFVKFSRDFDDPVRDRGRTQMEQEVRLAALALSDGFPIPVPRPQFGDYHRESGTGILIAERIRFGANGIEPQYEKCLDYRMPDPFGHYQALLITVARLAGTQQSGRLPARIVDRFPVDLTGATVGDQAPMTADQLHRRLDRLADFATAHTALLPDRVRDPAFLSRLAREAPRVLAHEPAIWRYLAGNTDYLALCHWNANVDNAWFSTDAAGELQCGLMDWGCVGRMNVAMAVWGALCAAETGLWDAHLDDLLQTFTDEVRRSGGADLEPTELGRQVLLYAAVMGIRWLLDVPARARFGPDTASVTRFDPRISADESVRAPLQMLTNMLNLWASHPLGEMLDALSSS